jgi:hypothetical protein
MTRNLTWLYFPQDTVTLVKSKAAERPLDGSQGWSEAEGERNPW